MKLIGSIPLVGGGFYPAKVLRAIIRSMGGRSPARIEEDLASFRRMTVESFRRGFTWILSNGASFRIALARQRVDIYALEEGEARDRPAPVGPPRIPDAVPFVEERFPSESLGPGPADRRPTGELEETFVLALGEGPPEGQFACARAAGLPRVTVALSPEPPTDPGGELVPGEPGEEFFPPVFAARG